MIWYIPTFYGDIKLKETSDKSCEMETENISKNEKVALKKLQATATKKGWIKGKHDLTLPGTVKFQAPIDKVAGSISRALKPGRKLVSAVKFADGQIEEVATRSFADTPEPEGPDKGPHRKKPTKKKKAATTVSKPIRGCPAPDFESADVKAEQVLCAFLTTEQQEDFKRYNRFLSTGATTGNRYMITSRHARDELARWQRTLYSLTEERAICTHDWSVPAAEEMLALHLLLTLPGHEDYLLGLDLEDARFEAIDTGLDEIIDGAVRQTVNAFVCRNEDLLPYEGWEEK